MNVVLRLPGVFVLGLLLTGCGRESKAPPPVAPADASLPTSPRGPVHLGESNAPLEIAQSGDINATLRQLTAALRDYVVSTRSVPKNFDEFATKSQITFPPPPAGQRYAIQGQEVVLSKR